MKAVEEKETKNIVKDKSPKKSTPIKVKKEIIESPAKKSANTEDDKSSDEGIYQFKLLFAVVEFVLN